MACGIGCMSSADQRAFGLAGVGGDNGVCRAVGDVAQRQAPPTRHDDKDDGLLFSPQFCSGHSDTIVPPM